MIAEKIVVLTNGNYFARLILERLFLEYTEQVAGVVLVRGDYGGQTGFRSLWQVGKRTALPYAVYKVVQYLMFHIAQRWRRDVWLEVAPMIRDLNIPFIEVARVNSQEVFECVRGWQPTLGVSVSCPQRIRTKILGLPPLGFLNIHSSLLPKYAGLAPYFWVLAENQRETGITVHYMTEQFDEGNILVQRRVSIPQGISAFWLFRELALLGRDALIEAIHLALQGEKGIPQELSKRSYRSHPSWGAYRLLRRNGFAIARLSELLRAAQEAPMFSTEITIPKVKKP
jgi:methionyl-tRNA formyltransferase